MTSIHEQYFKTIYDDFAAKIEVLSKLIQSSPVEQGRIVEDAVRDLLREYLPTRYSFGTGFVVDSEGQQSRQCDIVIYDTVVSAGMLSRTGPLLFPVEAVYGVVEVKSTLNKKEIFDAFSHVASVKRLNNKAKPTVDMIIDKEGEPAVLTTKPSPPIGIVLGYRCTTRNLSRINRWFDEAMAVKADRLLHPDFSVSIQEGVAFRYQKTSHIIESLERKMYAVPLRNSEGQFMRSDEGGQQSLSVPTEYARRHEYEDVREYDGYSYNTRYRICGDKVHGYVFADGPRSLIESLNSITGLLNTKRLSGTAIEEYLSPYFGEALRLERVIQHQAKLQEIRDSGRAERHRIYDAQSDNIKKVCEYLTNAVSSLPEGQDRTCVDSGIRELISQYNALMLHTTSVNAQEFGEWLKEKIKNESVN